MTGLHLGTVTAKGMSVLLLVCMPLVCNLLAFTWFLLSHSLALRCCTESLEAKTCIGCSAPPCFESVKLIPREGALTVCPRQCTKAFIMMLPTRLIHQSCPDNRILHSMQCCCTAAGTL